MGLPILIVAFLALEACGDNLVLCQHDDRFAEPFDVCTPAQDFAARDSTELVPSQEAVSLYAARWQRAIESEPILRGRVPQRYLAGSIFTSNPKVVGAWSQQIVKTGDVVFDEIMAELRVEQIHPFSSSDGSVYLFGPYIRAHFNEDIFAERLAPTDSWPWHPANPPPWPPPERPQDDGHWTWLVPADGGEPLIAGLSGVTESATAQIDFRFGWGDCTVACLGFHDVRAVVPSDGPATVYDMGGDPLPDWLQLSPSTVPPP